MLVLGPGLFMNYFTKPFYHSNYRVIQLLKKTCLLSKMSGMRKVRQIMWLYHLNTRHPHSPVFRFLVFKWLLYSWDSNTGLIQYPNDQDYSSFETVHILKGVRNQTSANNSTSPRRSKNIWYSAIIRGRIVGRIVVQYSTYKSSNLYPTYLKGY